MRKFRLINAKGAEFNLMRHDAYFSFPDGLGMQREMTFAPIGQDFIKTSDMLSQKNITGNIAFEGYGQYREFTDFCAVAPLKLCYMPQQTWHYLDCELFSISKQEINRHNNRLVCPVDFIGLGPWYENKKMTRAGVSTEDAKKYKYKYPYRYGSGSAGTVRVTITGNEPSPCKLYIFGACINPHWTHFYNGLRYASGGVTSIIGPSQLLIVDSIPHEMEIWLYERITMTRIRNMYSSSDFSSERFIYLPPGDNAITFTHSGGNAIEAYVEVAQIAGTV